LLSTPITRRAVLGSAVAGGAGAAGIASVAVVRVFGLDVEDLWPGHERSRSGWSSPLSGDAARVAHLLRRTTFGATTAELERAVSDGYRRTVDRLVEEHPAEPPGFSTGDGTPLNVRQLQLWWVRQMLSSPTPFAERMTLFWHGHFTSDYRKVGAQTPFVYWQNLTWRRMGLTKLRSMLTEVTRDPAMLRYLDLASSTPANPNENYARELMELFTMGLHYTEDDVRAAARALAGWKEPRPDGYANVDMNGTARRVPVYRTQKVGEFRPGRGGAAPQAKFLGRTQRWDTQKVIDHVLAQPQTAPFVAGKVAREFLHTQPEGAFVNRLADGFRKSSYDVRTLLRDLFTSDEFVADRSYRGLVKNPTEYVVSVLKAVGAPQLAPLAVSVAADLGQVLFDPPDVGGWPANEAWISSNNVLARVNFVTQVLRRATPLPPAGDAAKRHLDGVLSSPTARAVQRAADDRARWLSVLAGPEFQLK
jgi:uncharacterized protein (DUF1800 family)